MKLTSSLSLLISMGLQGLAVHSLLLGDSLSLALAAHLCSSLLWGFGTTFLFPQGQCDRWWLPAACALMFPILGALASFYLIHVLRQKPPLHNDDDYIIWNAQTEARWKRTHSQPVSPRAVIEILQSPQPSSRRNAILSLRNLDPKFSIPLLRKGLLDSDEQVRIYAQNILSDILSHFEERIKHLEQAQIEDPADKKTALRLAEYYFELVYLDVSGDSDSDAHHLSKALSLLQKAHQIAPESERVSFLAMKYSLRANNLPEAKKWINILEQQNFDPIQLAPWKLEIAYLERDWARLRVLFSEYDHDADINPRIGQLKRFWFGSPQQSA